MERNEAIELRLLTYDTGRPCKHGHPSLRYTSSGICVECAKNNTTKSAATRARRIAAFNAQLVRIDAWVHCDDVDSIRAAIEACNAMRNVVRPIVVDAPVPLVGMTQAELYQATVRIHGKTTADYLLTLPPVPRAGQTPVDVTTMAPIDHMDELP